MLKISVATVCFNSRATIGHTIDSFLDQSWPNKELLIVDGASTDGTLNLIARYDSSDITVLSEPDTGIYNAMNKALTQFTGDAVGFLNSDDRFYDRAILAAIAEGLDDHDIVFGDIRMVRDHKGRDVVRLWKGSPFRQGAFRYGWMPAHPSFYVRRSVVETVGLFDETLTISADYDYMLRALEMNHFKSGYLNRVLVDMQYGGSSTCGIAAYLDGNLQSLRSRRKWLGAPLVDGAMFLKPARKITQWLS